MLEKLLELSLPELISQANKVRKECVGKRIELCSIVNAKSGLCSEDCRFCAQSARYTTDVSTYPLKNKEQIVSAARQAKQIGAERFGIVTSGNTLSSNEVDVIAGAVREIMDKVGISVCASLGALEKQKLDALKQAGLSRYHHNIETSPRFYPRIASTHSFNQRLNTIRAAKEAGLEVCSGGIIGMGESWRDKIEMACLLKELAVDSVPINLLVPVPGTPLESLTPISCKDALRTISIFRIILKDKTIKIAAGRETVLQDFQGAGFMAGANGMLIGGYLSIKGREVEKDRQLVKEIEHLWTE
jgi:biotin synthase